MERVMLLDDEALVRGLEARDGPMPLRTRRHWEGGVCRYADRVGDRPCPWCDAERRRLEAGSAAATPEA